MSKKFILVLILLSLILTSCNSTLTGEKILAVAESQQLAISDIEISYINRYNPVKSSKTMLKNNDEHTEIINLIIDYIKNGEEVNKKQIFPFSPQLDCSHHIVLSYKNKEKLTFYYFEEKNWLIWQHDLQQNDKKILDYKVLKIDNGLSDILISIKPV